MSSVAGTCFLPIHVCRGEKGVIPYFILRNWLTWLQRSITWFGSCVPAKVHVIKNWSLERWYWAMVEPSENDAESLGHRGLSSQRRGCLLSSFFLHFLALRMAFSSIPHPHCYINLPVYELEPPTLYAKDPLFPLWAHYLKCFMIK